MHRLADWWKLPFAEMRQVRRFRRQIEAENGHRLSFDPQQANQEGWISTSPHLLDLRDHRALGRYFHRSTVDALFADQLWGQWTLQEGRDAAKNCFQYLKPGGYLRIAVADGFHPSPRYLECERSVSCPPRSCSLYNYVSIRQLFGNAGFDCKLIEYFDEEGNFHSNPWDVSKGLVRKSLLFDSRNLDEPYQHTSLILDAVKPDADAMGISNPSHAVKAGVFESSPAFNHLPMQQDAA